MTTGLRRRWIVPWVPRGSGAPGKEAPTAPLRVRGQDILATHRRRSLEALDRCAGGQPLCRVNPEASGRLKQAEGAVAALSQVARRHQSRPEEDLRTSAAHVLQAWTAELGERDGPHWVAYRTDGEQAIDALLTDLTDL